MAIAIGRRSATAVIAVSFVVLSAPRAMASCAEPLPDALAIEQGQTVFVGTVTGLDNDGRLATFAVDDVWKGEVSAIAVVNGGPSLAELKEAGLGADIATSVDRWYELGARYLVVSHEIEDGVYRDNACSATQIYEARLDEFRPDWAHAPSPVETDGTATVARVALAVVGALTVGGVLITRRRQKSEQLPPDNSQPGWRR